MITEICGITPLARTFRSKMNPYPASDAAPSWIRAPPESLIWTNGAPVEIARSITLHTFCACTSPIDPPKTVKSWEATKTFRPSTVPYPVTTPSPGGRLRSIPKSCARCTAKGSVSTKEPRSISNSTRSRAVSLPRSCCFFAASLPPGVRAAFLRLRSSSIRSSTVIVFAGSTSLPVVVMGRSLFMAAATRMAHDSRRRSRLRAAHDSARLSTPRVASRPGARFRKRRPCGS